MIWKYIPLFIITTVTGLICLLLFTCSKKSTKPKAPPEPAPQMYVYPTYFNFGKMTSPVETTFTIKNTGGGVLSGVVIVDTSARCECTLLLPNDTIHYEGLSYDFSAGEGGDVMVRYFPTDFGPDEPWSRLFCRLLSVAIIPGDTLWEDILLNGYRPRPEPLCSLSTHILDFDTVEVGNYVQKSFTLTNIGPEGSILSGNIHMGLCVDFSIIEGLGDYNLAAGETRNVTVVFAPGTGSVYNCTIRTYYDPLDPDKQGICGDVFCIGIGKHSW